MRIAVVCALVWLTSSAASAEVDAFFRKGPYVQAPAPDAVTVMWEGAGARSAEVVLDTGETFTAGPALRQRVRVRGLEPGVRYQYEVRAGNAVARGELQAAPPPGSPISFAVAGNTRQNEQVRRLMAARVTGEHPDLLLGAGNLVSDGLSEHDWQRLFDEMRAPLASTPLYPALGRHDLQGAQRNADNVRNLFELPADAPEPGRYYAFTYGPARFVMLDSNLRDEEMDAQTAWLEAELASAAEDGAVERIFAVTHHGPFSVGLHGGDERIRDAWVPLFEAHGVDALFSAHDHVYSRAEAGGVRYFVTGGGGAPLYRRDRRADKASVQATQRFESSHHYLRVDVGHGLVEVSARRLDGTIIETVRWGEPSSPSPALQAEIDALLAAPVPEQPPTSAPPPRSAAKRAPDHDAALGLRLAALSCLLAGGGAILVARRRA